MAPENGLEIFSKGFFVSEREKFKGDILEGRVGSGVDARTYCVSRREQRWNEEVRLPSLRKVLFLIEEMIGMFGVNRAFALCRFQWIVGLRVEKMQCRRSLVRNQ